MAQDYDKIWKENIDSIILPLAKKLLNIEANSMEQITTDLQLTLERKPDFLRRVRPKDEDDGDYILHIEFQSADDKEMHFRMLEYNALLLRKYKLEVRQYVFYIGAGASKMEATINMDKLDYSFEVFSLQTIPYRYFIESETPEEVILAILGDFDNKTPTEVATELLTQLNILPTETLRKEKCVKQLEILSNLRNLQSIIVELIPKIMALEYDIKKDLRYLQGREEGIETGMEKGMEKGIQQGIEKGMEKGIKKALQQGLLTIEQIAELFEVSTDYVLEINAKIGL